MTIIALIPRMHHVSSTLLQKVYRYSSGWNQAIPIHCYTQPYLSLNAWMCNCAAWYRCQLYSRAPIRHLIGSSVAVQSGAKSVFMVLWTEVSHTEPRVPTQCRGRKSWHFCHSAEGLTSSLEGTMKCHQCHWNCKNGCSELVIEACNSSWKIEWHLQRGQVFREVGEFVHPSHLKSWIARHPVTLMSSWMLPEKKSPARWRCHQ